MMRDIHDLELQTLLLDADPVDVTALRDICEGTGAAELREAITREAITREAITREAITREAITREAITREARPAVPPRRRRRLALLAVAAVAAATLPLALMLVDPSSTRDSAYAAQVIQFAKQSPRLLLAQRGWRVTDLNQEYADAGQMTFGSGSRSIELDWDTPVSTFGPPSGQVAAAIRIRIDGHRAAVGRSAGGGPRYFAALWSEGDVGIRALGHFAHFSVFVALMRTLHRVSVPTLLAALPAGVITPAGRKQAVDRMLADVPQPDGFDPSGLSTSTLLLDRYQLGARVTSAVSCAWLDQWLHGDTSRRSDASAAMQTSRHWAILREMAPEGGWAQGIWAVADNMNGTPLRGLIPGETEAGILKNHLCC